MTTATCPKCDDQVSLPDRASSQATVRCPLCQDEFPLADILQMLPPVLVVVADPEAVAEQKPAIADSGVFSGVGPNASAEPISIASRTASTPAPTTTSRGRGTSYSPRPKKQKNPLVEVVKIVLGGVAGLAIAQLILWWMPWKNMRRDPLKMGPKVASVIPWAVPETFHGNPQIPDQEDLPPSQPPSSDGSGLGGMPSEPAGDGEGGVSESGLPDRTFMDPNGDGSEKPAEEPEANRPTTAGTDADIADDPFGLAPDTPADSSGTDENDASTIPGLSMAPDGDDLGDAGEVSLDLDLFDDPPGLGPEPSTGEADSPAASRPQDAPKTSAAELRLALEDARGQVAKWDGLPAGQLREQFVPTYQMLAKLGETLAWLDPPAEAETQQAAELLETLAKDDTKLALLAKGTFLWLGQEDRASDGVLIVGQVKKVDSFGEWSVTEIQVDGTDKTVAVFSNTAPDADGHLQAGAKVMLLGATVDNASADFKDYAGDASVYVWNGFSVAKPQP